MTAWDVFFQAAVRQSLTPGFRVLDIGAGLRLDAARGNVVDPTRAWIKPLLAAVTYEVMDAVDTYHPDIVGDIQAMPIADRSYDAVICLAVLEHVREPWTALREMRRVLKPGGVLVCYVPFLSPYHAMPGYYGDYFRFTEDGIRSLLSEWHEVQTVPVRGPVETLSHLLPGRLHAWCGVPARALDRRRRGSGKQASGFFCTALCPNP